MLWEFQVLKIFIHLCNHASSQFLTELRRNSTFIQQASGLTLCFLPITPQLLPGRNIHSHFAFSVYSGPPDPIHGTALYQKVRNTAQVRHKAYSSMITIICIEWLGRKTKQKTLFVNLQEVARLLFTDKISTKSSISSMDPALPTMGK